MSMNELTLPSGAKVGFRAPRNSDRHSVIRQFSDERGKGPSDVELLAGFCITTINGEPPRHPHPAVRMETWSIKDVQFYQGVFLEMFFLNGESDLEQVKEAAKKMTSPEQPIG